MLVSGKVHPLKRKQTAGTPKWRFGSDDVPFWRSAFIRFQSFVFGGLGQVVPGQRSPFNWPFTPWLINGGYCTYCTKLPMSQKGWFSKYFTNFCWPIFRKSKPEGRTWNPLKAWLVGWNLWFSFAGKTSAGKKGSVLKREERITFVVVKYWCVLLLKEINSWLMGA